MTDTTDRPAGTAKSRGPAKSLKSAKARIAALKEAPMRVPGLYLPGGAVVAYKKSKNGVDAYARQISNATPMQIVEIERAGVPGSLIKDLSKRMEIPSSRIFRILGVPKATAEKKAAAGTAIAGRGGQAAIGMVKLLGIAQQLVADSKAKEAQNFDAAKWLGVWIDRPQPSLGGRKPSDLLDTPTGVAVVSRLLSSIQSGAYQ